MRSGERLLWFSWNAGRTMVNANGLYGHIRNNNLKSFALFLTFAVTLAILWAVLFQTFVTIFGFVGWLPRSFMKEWSQRGVLLMTFERLHYPFLAAILWTIGGVFFHAYIIRLATGAQALQRRQAPKLYNMVENLAITAGIPMPRIEIMESPALNAYAAGLSPDDATVAVTRGLLDTLNERELEAVIAHEITHIKNYDTRMMVIAAVLSGTMCMIAELAWRHIVRQKTPIANIFRDERSDEADLIIESRNQPSSDLFAMTPWKVVVGLILLFVMPFLLVPVLVGVAVRRMKARRSDPTGKFRFVPSPKLLFFPPFWPVWFTLAVTGAFLVAAYVLAAVARGAISRSREFMADAGAVELTKDASSLVSALLKLRNRDEIPDLDPCVAAMMISSPRRDWLATHPSLDDRISALQQFAGAPSTSTWRRRNGREVLALADVPFSQADAGAGVVPAPAFGRKGAPPAAALPHPASAGFAPSGSFGRRRSRPLH